MHTGPTVRRNKLLHYHLISSDGRLNPFCDGSDRLAALPISLHNSLLRRCLIETESSRRVSLPTASSAALGDADHRRPQQAVMQHIAGLQHLDDGAARLVRPLGLEDRLVEIVVEALALRIDALDPVALEDAQAARARSPRPRRADCACVRPSPPIPAGSRAPGADCPPPTASPWQNRRSHISMHPRARAARGGARSRSRRARAAADPYTRPVQPRASAAESPATIPRPPTRSAPRRGRRYCCWRPRPRAGNFSCSLVVVSSMVCPIR